MFGFDVVLLDLISIWFVIDRCLNLNWRLLVWVLFGCLAFVVCVVYIDYVWIV